MAQSMKAPTSQNFIQKTLGSQMLAGATVATLNNVTSIQNLPGVAIIDRVDANGVSTPSTREVITFTGTSGSTLTGVVKNADGAGTDQIHAVGAIVEFGPDILWAQSMYDGLSQVVVPSTGLVDTTKVVTLTGSQTLTNKTVTSPVITNKSSTGTDSGVETLTNKRITKRVVVTTQSATPTINTDNTDVTYITGLAQAVTSFTTNLSGTPVNGDTLIIDITDNGTARALTFGASFESSGNVALPTTTVISTKLAIGFRWNTATSKWTCVAVA